MITRRIFLGGGAILGQSLLAGGHLMARTGPGGITDVTALSLGEAAEALRRGHLSPVDLTRACLDRIASLDSVLNAFITVTADQALDAARVSEQEISRGRIRGPLHGIPIALKDNIDTAGVRTTAAAAAFADRVPATDAEVVRRLREAGAVLLGKLNMDECAYGVTSATGHFGAVRNPWQLAHVAGGSSGGPAAAVAARLCYGALGTDTGGSIRQPAAYCGIVGLKPTYGLVSNRGIVPLSWSLDHVGPMCRTVGDTALMLQAIAGFDPVDAASIEVPSVDYSGTLERDLKGLRLGRPAGNFFEGLDPEIGKAVESAIEVLRDLTSGVREVELPAIPPLAVLFVEAAGFLGPELKKSPEGFSASVRQLVEMGGRISAASYAEAKRQLELARRAIRPVFAAVDLLVTPATPDMPATLAASGSETAGRGPPLTARNTTPMNIYGLPTLSVPCGFSRSGLPIGLQISGPPLGEAAVLALAHAYQQRTDWHRRRPPEPTGNPAVARS